MLCTHNSCFPHTQPHTTCMHYAIILETEWTSYDYGMYGYSYALPPRVLAGGFDYEQMETRVSLSGQNPFEELLITIINDGDYDGPDDEEFFVQVRLDPNGQNSERVRISPDLAEVSINIMDNELRPGNNFLMSARLVSWSDS